MKHPFNFSSPVARGLTFCAALAIACLSLAETSALRAATISHSNDTVDPLNSTSSWTGGVVPGTGDTAQWDSTVTGANSVALGAGLSWLGIRILSPGGAVTITPDGNTLTLGTGGIDMSAATQNLTIQSGLTLAAGGQTWNVATGETLTINTGVFTRTTGATLLVDKSVNTGAVTFAPTLTNSVLPWAIVKSAGTAANNSANGYTFATVTGGNIVPYTAATAVTANYPGSSATTNYDWSSAGTQGTIGSSRAANTIRYTGAGVTQQTNSTQTETIGALINAGTGAVNLGGGAQTMNYTAPSGDLILGAMTAGINMNGPITGASIGLTIMGAGGQTVALAAVSSYGGATTVGSGTLLVSGAGSINTTSGITISGSGAKLVYASSVTETPAITLTRGTLDGTGKVGTVTVGVQGGIVTNGNGAAATLTIASLTFSGAGSINAVDSAAFTGTPIAVTGVLTTPNTGGGEIVVGGAGAFATGTDTLFNYASLTGGLSDFSLGTFSGLSGRQNVTGLVLLSSTAVAVKISGDSLVWTGTATDNAGATTWNTAVTSSATSANPNWVLKNGHTTTDFWAGDTVEFDDTANVTALGGLVTPSTTVTIHGGTVAPASVTFNNSVLNYTINTDDGSGISTAAITKNGAGSVMLSASANLTGASQFNAGTFALVSGTIGGTGSLNVASNDTFTEDVNSVIAGSTSISNTGSMTLSGTNTYTGATTINGGTFALTAGGSLAGTPVNVGAAGVLSEDAASVIAGSSSLTSSGLVTLSGSNTYSGATTIASGTLALPGTLVSSGNVAVGTTGGTGVLSVSGNLTANSIAVGGATVGSGAVYQSGGSAVFTAAKGDTDFSLGGLSQSTPGYGYYSITSGSLTANALDIGSRSTATVGVMDLFGGTVASTGGVSVARGNSTTGAGSGLLNITGGTFNWEGVDINSQFEMGDTTGQAVVNVGGGAGPAALTGTGAIAAPTAGGIDMGRLATGATAIINLLPNGTLTTQRIGAAVADTSLINFNGGTLAASATNAGSTFLSSPNITAVTVYSGGGTINNNGTNITIGNALVAPAGLGVASIPVSGGGAGYIGAPFVQITGGGGTGATGYAVMSNGAISQIVITSPGTGYTSAPSITLLGGGATSAATVGTPTLNAGNTGGGMTFQGAGVTTLSGTSSYTGPTNVNAGTLTVTGVITGSTLNVAAGATLSSGAAGTSSEIEPTSATSTAAVISGTLSPGGLGTIAPINFTLQTGAKLNFQPGSSLLLDLASNGTSDSVAFASLGNWLFGSGNATLALNGTITYTDAYTIITNVSTAGFAFGSITGYDSVDFTAQVAQVGGNSYVLTFQAIPEPGTFGMILGGVGLLGCWHRMRRTRRS